MERVGELDQSSLFALAVCEAHRSDSVIAAIDFPMPVFSMIYGRLGREELFLVFTHLSLEMVMPAQKSFVVHKLIIDVADSKMGSHATLG